MKVFYNVEVVFNTDVLQRTKKSPLKLRKNLLPKNIWHQEIKLLD